MSGVIQGISATLIKSGCRSSIIRTALIMSSTYPQPSALQTAMPCARHQFIVMGVLGETATTGSNPATEKAAITYEIIGRPPIRINGFSPRLRRLPEPPAIISASMLKAPREKSGFHRASLLRLGYTLVHQMMYNHGQECPST